MVSGNAETVHGTREHTQSRRLYYYPDEYRDYDKFSCYLRKRRLVPIIEYKEQHSWFGDPYVEDALQFVSRVAEILDQITDPSEQQAERILFAAKVGHIQREAEELCKTYFFGKVIYPGSRRKVLDVWGRAPPWSGFVVKMQCAKDGLVQGPLCQMLPRPEVVGPGDCEAAVEWWLEMSRGTYSPDSRSTSVTHALSSVRGTAPTAKQTASVPTTVPWPENTQAETNGLSFLSSVASIAASYLSRFSGNAKEKPSLL
jgi:hypothetical protein